jgi:hypothetical protein
MGGKRMIEAIVKSEMPVCPFPQPRIRAAGWFLNPPLRASRIIADTMPSMRAWRLTPYVVRSNIAHAVIAPPKNDQTGAVRLEAVQCGAAPEGAVADAGGKAKVVCYADI